jgi:hypothetical protein
MRQNLLSQNLFSYEENIVIKENKNNNDLRKVNKDVQLLCTDWKNRIYIIHCSSESTLIQNKSSVCCQIWETNLYDTYMIVVTAVVAAECVIQSQCWKVSIKEDFHIQEIVMIELKKWIVTSLYKTENHVLTSNKNLIYKPYLNDIKPHVNKQFIVWCSFLLIKT